MLAMTTSCSTAILVTKSIGLQQIPHLQHQDFHKCFRRKFNKQMVAFILNRTLELQ